MNGLALFFTAASCTIVTVAGRSILLTAWGSRLVPLADLLLVAPVSLVVSWISARSRGNGTAMVLGVMTGAVVAAIGAQWIGTDDLLLVGAAALVLAWVGGQYRRPVREGRAARWCGGTPSRYRGLLALWTCLAAASSVLISYQLNRFAEAAFSQRDQRTTCLALLAGGVGALAFFGRRLPPAVRLLVQPAVDERFELPTSASGVSTPDRRLQAAAPSIGFGLAALIGVICLQGRGWSWGSVGMLTGLVLLIQLGVASALSREHAATIRTLLRARALAQQPAHAASLEPIAPLTAPPSSTEKLALLQQVFETISERRDVAQPLIQQLAECEPSAADREALGYDAGQIKTVILDEQAPLSARRQAVRMLAHWCGQTTVDELLSFLSCRPDALLRQEAAAVLATLRMRQPRLAFARVAVQSELERAAAAYRHLAQLQSVIRQHRRPPFREDNALIRLMGALRQDAIEQMLRLLTLVASADAVHVAAEWLRIAETGRRGQGLQALECVLDAPLRRLALPVLERHVQLAGDAGHEDAPPDPVTAYRLVRDAIGAPHQWLSVTMICAIGAFRWTTMREAVDEAIRDPRPTIATAAGVSLALAGWAGVAVSVIGEHPEGAI